MRAFSQGEQAWDELLLGLVEHPSFLQTAVWARIKQEQAGWRPTFWVWEEQGGPVAAALVLQRTLAPGLRVAYAPHGPVVAGEDPARWHAVLQDLQAWARRAGVMALKVDPPVPVAFGEPGAADEEAFPPGLAVQDRLRALGWVPSPEWVQFPNTLWLDLRADEDTLLARMKQKTRYNVRLAFRRGVEVTPLEPEDFPLLYAMYHETARRDGFPIRAQGYYLHLWNTLHQAGRLQAFVARVEGEPVAGLVLVHFGPTAWYLHGMSRNRYRNRMPNHALQWTAIRWARARGCTRYDFWGAPFRFTPEDPMWGVYRFKRGFGGLVVRTLGPWDWPARPMLYRLYHRARPALWSLWRRLARLRG